MLAPNVPANSSLVRAVPELTLTGRLQLPPDWRIRTAQEDR